MGIFKYGANLGRSFTYALPQVAKNIVPNLGDLFEQVKTEGRTGEIKDIFSEARTILKEDVGAVLRKGLDTALKDVTSGKLYKSDEETQAAASAAFGGQLGDTSLDDNDFLNADYYGSEGGDASGVSAAAAVGAASGVRAAAAAMGSSPEMQAAGVGAMATARLTRVGIGTSMAIGAGIERAIGASTRVLMDVHGFQNNVQHSYYKQSLENQTAMAGLLSDITAKMSTLIETTLVTATVTDRMLSAGSNRGIPLTRVFNPRGGINLAAYFSLLGNRLRSKVGEGSEFASFANGLTVTSPIGKAVEFMIEK